MILVASRETLVGPASYHGGWIHVVPASSSFDFISAIPLMIFGLGVLFVLWGIVLTFIAPLNAIADELRDMNSRDRASWDAEYLADRLKKPKPVRRRR